MLSVMEHEALEIHYKHKYIMLALFYHPFVPLSHSIFYTKNNPIPELTFQTLYTSEISIRGW